MSAIIPKAADNGNPTNGGGNSTPASPAVVAVASIITLLLGPLLVPKYVSQAEFNGIAMSLGVVLASVIGYVIHRKQQTNHQDMVKKLGENTAYINLVSKQTTDKVVTELKSKSANQFPQSH